MSNLTEQEPKCYNDLLKILESVGCYYPNSGDFFYRGLPDDKFELLPSLFYPPSTSFPKVKEKKILERFIADTSFGKKLNDDKRVWLNAFYARHWSLKSRMIDWTIDLSER